MIIVHYLYEGNNYKLLRSVNVVIQDTSSRSFISFNIS